MKKSTELRKGSRRVEAWVYTVINPLIEALKIEIAFLQEKNWTWSYETKDLDFILPLERYIDSASLPNLEDFLKVYPSMGQEWKNHEDLRRTLSENCLIAFNRLIALRTFKKKVESSCSIFGEYPGGAVPKMDFDNLIAKYVVNQVKDLPEHYTTSNFWARFGHEFFEFRIRKEFEKLDLSGKQLEEHDDHLLMKLKDLRSTLCEEYDVPHAPTITSYYD